MKKPDYKILASRTSIKFDDLICETQTYFQTCLFLACQYHRACDVQDSEFIRVAEDYIGEFESLPNEKEKPYSALMEMYGDELDHYIDQLSGSNRYKFKVLATAALKYFQIYKPFLIKNSYAMKNRLLIAQGYNVARRRKFFRDNWRVLQRPFHSFERMLKLSVTESNDVKNVMKYIETNIVYERDTAA